MEHRRTETHCSLLLRKGDRIQSYTVKKSDTEEMSVPQSLNAGTRFEINLNEAGTYAKDPSAYKEAQQSRKILHLH